MPSERPAGAVLSPADSAPATAFAEREPVATWNARVLLSILALTLLLASAPVRNSHYLLPLVVAVHLAMAGCLDLLRRMALVATALIVVSAVWSTLSLVPANPSGLAWGLVTYGTLIFWVSWRRGWPGTVDVGLLRSRGADLVAIFVLFQGAVGIAQFVLSRQPDRPDSVTGTIDPLQFWNGGRTLSQPSMAVMLIGSMLFLVAFQQRRTHRIAVGVGAVCLLLSQSGHQILILVSAAAFVVVALDPSPRVLLRVGAALLIVLASAQALTPDTLSRAPSWFERTMVDGESLKRQAWSDAFDVVADEALPGVGVGVGQFSSRAGLISSNEYLSVRLPEVLTGKSEVFIERVEPRLERYDRVGEGSAIAKPYSSATSLLAEFGPFVALGLAGLGAGAVVSGVRRGRLCSAEERRIRAAMAVGVAFVAGISFVENYLELPQAVFLPGVLYIVARSAADTLATA